MMTIIITTTAPSCDIQDHRRIW